MGTEILKSFGVLQSELDQARTSLKGVDENIKRLIGRDPSEILPRTVGVKRGPPGEENSRGGKQRPPVLIRNRNFAHEDNEEPSVKRRPQSVFKRLSDRPVQYEEEIVQQPQKIISKVIVTPREIPSRQEALAAQRVDEKSKARNRRMFGALLGTLQKFQQEETKLKSKELKRAQVEKKIEEHEIREKAEIKKERQELFLNRKKKQAEIKMIELKMLRMKEYATWEERQKPRVNFISTKAKPHLCYLPRRLNETTKNLLENSKIDVEKMIEKRKQEVFVELQHIEDRMKKNFELKKPRGGKEEQHEEQQHEEEHPEDVEREMEELRQEVVEDLKTCGEEMAGVKMEAIAAEERVTNEETENHQNSEEDSIINDDLKKDIVNEPQVVESSDVSQTLNHENNGKVDSD